MTDAPQGQDAKQHGHREAAKLGSDILDQLRVIDGLRQHKVSPGLNLALQHPKLTVEIGRTEVQGGADEEGRRRLHGTAIGVDALVEARYQLDHPGCRHVSNLRGLRVVAIHWHVAHHREHVAHAECVGTEKIGVEGEQVPVPQRHMHDGFDAQLGLHQAGGGESAHASLGTGAIGHVDGVDV